MVDEAGAPLEFANVVLLTAADSSFVAGSTTSADGSYKLRAPNPPGKYRARVSAIGYDDLYSAPITVVDDRRDYPLPDFILGAGAIQLETATVVADRPTITRQIDRTIVNVANQPAATAQTALEILERAPGVFVDRSGGNINMMGKDGVVVMVNGRLNYMQPDALLSFLAGIPGADIVQLELITTPPAGLDAEGNAGYINIVLKRLPDEGLRGGYTLTDGVASNDGEFANGKTGDFETGFVGGGGTNLTYRKGKISAFANLSYSRNETPESSYLRRDVPADIGLLSTDLEFLRDPARDVINGRVGLDYAMSAKTTLTVQAGGYLDDYDMVGQQRNLLSIGTADTFLVTDVAENNRWLHGSLGLSFNHQLPKGSLSGGYDYLRYNNDNPLTYAIDYKDPETEGRVREEDLDSDKESLFGINVVNLDYRLPTALGNFSTGIKGVRSTFDNDFTLLRDGVVDGDFSLTSELKEFIGAAYAELAGSTESRLEYRFGLRYEYTDTELLETGQTAPAVDRTYGNLFPSVALGYPLSNELKLTAGYNRRIQRPGFNQLASFVVFLEPRTNFVGNPGLQPSIADNLELGIQRGQIGLTISYSHVDSLIAGFQPTFDPATGRQQIIPLNLDNQRVLAANLGFPTLIAPWWKGRVNVTVSRITTKAFVEGQSLTTEQTTLQIGGGQNFNLGEQWTLSANGFYRGPSVNGYVSTLGIGSLNLSLSRSIAAGKLVLTGEDVLNTLRARNETFIPAADFRSQRGFNFSGPTVKVAYSRSFGNDRVNVKTQERALEERGRVE